jgi:hypothetical protein
VKKLRTKLPIVLSVTALVVALAGTSGPAIAHGVAHALYAHNADKVDGKHAVGAAATVNQRKGKLVATSATTGKLPVNIVNIPGAFARVAADGTLQPNVAYFPAQVKGVDTGDVVKGEGAAATGTYCFGSLGFRPSSAIVSLDNADAAAADRNLIASVALDRGEDLGDCPATHNQARVRIVDGNTGAAQDGRFFVWFLK